MKRSSPRRRKPVPKDEQPAKTVNTVTARRAAISRNGRNQAGRLPQDLELPDKVKVVLDTRYLELCHCYRM